MDLTTFIQDIWVLQFGFLEVYAKAPTAIGNFHKPCAKLMKRQQFVSTYWYKLIILSKKNLEAGTTVFGNIFFGVLLEELIGTLNVK